MIPEAFPKVLTVISAEQIANIRLTAMFTVLVTGLLSGYLFSKRFSDSEYLAKKIMTAVLIGFNSPIALFAIWQIKLSVQLIWLPIAGLCLMSTISFLSIKFFTFLKLEEKARLTLTLAGGLSNLGYTGGAFVCYVLFGTVGLAMANIYLLLWLPTAYLIFFPMLKTYEIRSATPDKKPNFTFRYFLDLRLLGLLASIIAIILNLANIKHPQIVFRLHIIDLLIYSASLLCFFAIGLRVRPAHFKNYINLYFILSAVKFIITPVIAFLILWLLAAAGVDLNILVKKVIIVMAVAPTAVFMVTMSNAFGLDSQLASALWLVNTFTFLIIVMPILILLLN